MINARDKAVFEAGIKLGALYHQFVGTPVSLNTLESLARAIEQSIGLQPCVQSIRVLIDREMVEKKSNNVFGYSELEGKMLEVHLKVLYKNISVHAELGYDAEKDYPLMRIKKIEEI